jgi:peptidoglycan/LPS O-acetylase OafA/YrhL
VWSAIALAVVSRCFYTGMGWAPFQVNIFTVDNLDTLALGALLAYLVTYRRDKVVLTRRIALGAGVAMFFVMTILRIPILSAGLFQLGTGLVALWVVSNVADGVGGPVGRVLSFRPLLYIGRISYGIYVYHLFVPKEMHQLLRRFPAAEHGILFVAICFVVMMAISSLSWFLLENPINSLKNKFRGSARRSNPKSNAFENELLVNAMQSRLAA